jgi:RNA polymerase sigma factor (sigma-70 family)
MTPEQLFLAHLPLINKVVAQICRRYHFQKEEIEQFLSEVQDKIMADDYAVLRKFEGKCSLKRYLVVVIGRQMLDFQNRLWGKWRPCEMAKKLGPVAVHLDRLLHRDGHSFDEAVELLRTNHKVEMSWQDLYEIVVRLPPRPPRPPRHPEDVDVLGDIPSSDDPPDARVVQQEKNALLNRALEVLLKALKALAAEDQVILRMAYWDHFSVANIAKLLKLDPKPLYKRIEKTREHLKREMERQGIRKEDIDDLFDE